MAKSKSKTKKSAGGKKTSSKSTSGEKKEKQPSIKAAFSSEGQRQSLHFHTEQAWKGDGRYEPLSAQLQSGKKKKGGVKIVEVSDNESDWGSDVEFDDADLPADDPKQKRPWTRQPVSDLYPDTSHRIGTILDSSRILVVDAGKIAEFDTPAALIENPNSIFRALAVEAGLVNSGSAAGTGTNTPRNGLRSGARTPARKD